MVVNFAVTERACVIVTEHVPVVFVHAPVHPSNVEPSARVAVNTTVALLLYVSLQSLPQSMPDGAEVTLPEPVPDFVTVSANVGTDVKLAVTLLFAVIITLHVGPVQAPLQPLNMYPSRAVAVRETGALNAYIALHVGPQLMLLSVVDTTSPPAVGLTVTESEYVAVANVGWTVLSVVIVTLHTFPLTESHPAQPANVDPCPAVGVSATICPSV
jgi:hypothetical protein